jgi:hypothetical protein
MKSISCYSFSYAKADLLYQSGILPVIKAVISSLVPFKTSLTSAHNNPCSLEYSKDSVSISI